MCGLIRKILCLVFGHRYRMKFHSTGLYWCWSAGAFDCFCKRCNYSWENTLQGQEALIKSNLKDPRRCV